MGMGKKSSPPPSAPKPIETPNNNNIPDDAAKRGVPIRGEASPMTQSLLTPEEQKQQGLLG